MMVKKILGLVAVAVVFAVLAVGVAAALDSSRTEAVFASSVAGIRSAGETGIQIQNVDRMLPATIRADFYRSAGAWEQSANLPLTAPGAAANIWLPGTALPSGAYGVQIYADRQIAAIARTDWPRSGGAAYYSNVIPGNDIAVPLAVRNFFGQCSIISIQNTDIGAQAQITVDIFETGAGTPTLSQDYSIPTGASITMDLCNSDLEFDGLGTGFLGSIHVSSATKVGVVSFIDITTSDKAVYAFEGVPAEMASPTLYVPLFRAMQHPRPGDPSSGRLDTGFSVVNPGATSVQVAVTYRGAGGTCRGETVTSPPATIAPHSSHVFYQGDPASQGLKDDCYGSAVIQSSTGGILAIVNEAQNLNQTSAAYNAMTADQGATTVALPLYRNSHASGLTTGISVMNLGTEDAQITLSLNQNRPDGSTSPVNCGAACSRTVGALQTAIFWPGSISAIPPNTYGSASVQSTQPVAVIVNDVNPFTGRVDMATYNGIKADYPDVPGGADAVGLPWILTSRSMVTPIAAR